MAYVFAPDGTPGEVPDDQLQTALAQKFRLREPSADEVRRKTASDQPGQAALEGVARGATMGFGEEMLSRIEAEAQGKPRSHVRAEMKARKEENPLAAGAGELGGVVATSLATGGGASALAGGGLKGALVEGGLYGMGSMVSEDALENRAATVDRLAAGLVGGALASGVAHGGFKLLGKTVSAVTSKMGGKGLKDTLSGLADEAEWRALSEGNAPLAARLAPFKQDILKSGRDNGVLGTVTSAFDSATAKKAKDVAAGFGEKISTEMKQLESYVPLKGNAELRNESADYVESRLRRAFGDSPTHEDAYKAAQKYVKSIREKDRSWDQWWNVQSTLFKEKVGDTAAGEVREELRQAMRDFVFDEVASGKNKAGAVLSAFEPRSLSGKVKLPAPEIAPRTIRLGEDPVVGGLQLSEYAPTVVEGMHPPLKGTQLLHPDVAATPLGRDIPGVLGRTRGAVSVEGATSQPGGIFEFPGSRAVGTAVPESPSPLLDLRPATSDIAPLTIRLGEEAALEKAGGLVLDVPEVKTPAWFGAQLRQTGRDAAAAQALAKMIGKRAQSIESSGGLLGLGSLKSIGAGAVGGSFGGPVGAIAGAALETQMRKRGGLLGGAALRAIAESRVTSGISRGLAGRIGTILSTAPEVLGAYRYPLAVAAAKGADALVQEHLRLASSDQGQHYLSTLGLPVESPEEVDAAGQRLAVLDALEASTQAQTEELDAAVSGLFGASPGRKGSVSAVMAPKEFKVASESIAAILKDPTAAFEQVPAELRAGAPATATEAAGKLVQIAQFLDSKMPKSPFQGMPAALAPPWQPSSVEIDRFGRYAEAVNQPARVLKNMARGFISPEQVEALQAVYPAMYADLQQKISERLLMQKKPLPYQQRAALAAILGPQALGMTPQQVQILQQSQVMSAGAGQPGSATKGPDGRGDVDEESIQTESQKLEKR